ncbi:MAG: DNA topoisomerase subunit B [Candidatus Paceibacterota bacterium]
MAKKKKKQAPATGYRADDIQVLEGLDPVRKRPGMYIGTTGIDGLHHLITEVFDNSRDEAMADYADRIEVVLLPDNKVRITDNGRGIPVDEHKDTGTSALEVIMTTLHAGGKFGGEGYKVSGGLHGVGVSVVNALSSWTQVRVHRDGGEYMQEYKIGAKQADVKKLGKSDKTGTIITFHPDAEVFETLEFKWDRIVSYLRQQAYLVPGLRVHIIDAREYEGEIDDAKVFYFDELALEVPSVTNYFEGGLKSLVRDYNSNYEPLHNTIFYHEDEVEGVQVEIAFQYVDEMSIRLLAFANNIFTKEGGTHVTGFKAALTRTLNNYARSEGVLKEKDDNFAGDDALEGITAVVSVKLPEVQFEGQTKAKLGSTEARGAVEKVFNDALDLFLEEHPNDGKSIVKKVQLALRARKAAKAAKDNVIRKGALENVRLPGKLADCQTKKAHESELFVVEGDSAGGTAKTGRDRRTQAILPLRGKILNVERKRLDRMLKSESIKNLVIALGTAIGDTFDIEDLRYHKIIIATDADVDGAHIRTLLLTLFYRYFEPLIDAGHIYIAQPPLYKITKGKTEKFVYTEAEKEKYLKELIDADAEDVEDLEEAAKSASGVSLQRYKGLGEMNAEELWDTTMNPETRTLKQVEVDDAQAADKIFDVLMGKDVAARKSFIQSNAKIATVDI